MSVVTGLDAIRNKIESRPSSGKNVSDRELTRNIKPGGERTIRFVQELDPDAKNYDEKYGLGLVVSEFEHPNYFFFKLVDTFDEEEACWPVEQGWENKLTLYINVVDVESGDVYYLSRSVLGGLGEQIVESAGDRGTLTDSLWKIKKTGEGMGTRYKLNLLDIVSDDLDVDPDDLIDFREDVLNEVPYDKQEAFVREFERRQAEKKNDSGGSGSADDGDDDDVW